MAFEFETDDDEVSQRADDLIRDMEPKPAPEEEGWDEDYMGEVDKRMEITSYYRALLHGHLFDSDTSEAAQTVEKEVQHFVRRRLEVLLGMRSAVAPAPAQVFSPDEIAALKMFAGKLLAKPEVLQTPAEKKTPPEPTLKQVQAPPAAAKPVRRAPKPVQKPALVSAPTVRPTVAIRKEAPKPPVPAATPPAVPALPEAPVIRQTTRPDGVVVDIKAQRRQRPSTAVPFPTDMASALERVAEKSLSLSENIRAQKQVVGESAFMNSGD